MIDLLPAPQDRFPCPCGGGDLTPHAFRLVGMAPLARCRCEKCQRRFLAHLHVGFCNLGNLIADEEGDELQASGVPDWYAADATRAFQSRGRPPNEVRRTSRRPLGEDIVLVNCLDPTYGHCVRRLYSIDDYRQKGFTGSLVAIVPAYLEWQVPDDVDEIWAVEAPSYECYLDNPLLAALVDELGARATRLRYGHVAYQHAVDISRYLRVSPFAATGHDMVTPPRLTLNWREDRCWTLRGEASADAVQEQLRLYTLLLETLRRQAPDLDAAVTGYGRSGAFPGWVQDMRLAAHDADMERRWAKRYAASHLTLGMHGSNMNLPAALSRGALEIVLPRHWYSIGVSWQWVNRVSAWEAVGRYRQVPASSSVSDIASVTLLQLRRMQSGAGYELIAALHGSETAQDIAQRHADAFAQPEPVTCRDEQGRPI
ncbi:MAG: hypothetical protein AB7R90_02705 [Reyranellaceae bacterium]